MILFLGAPNSGGITAAEVGFACKTADDQSLSSAGDAVVADKRAENHAERRP